jgi:hypothetical protein
MLKNTSSSPSMTQGKKEKERGGERWRRRHKCGVKTEPHST